MTYKQVGDKKIIRDFLSTMLKVDINTYKDKEKY